MQQQDPTMTLPHDIKSKKNKQLSHCFMKPSLSMNALPPEGVRENSELSPARLRVDRPYNSLKKKRDSDKTIWRRSWESGHSHSSCSLQSNITSALSGNGKDEFWAALQTNYNYIMDTNLLDSCREARGELECVKSTEVKKPDCCQKSTCQSSRSQGSPVGDPRRLRRWLREMENSISKTPSLLEAMKLRIHDLEKLIGQHSILHREIASQARSVAVCIRNSEKENYTEEQPDSLKDTSISSNNSNDKSDEKSISPSGSRRSESGLKGLERRYHLLYLKAIEVQCMLENILESHQSSASSSKNDTDEEPVAKVARLNDAKYYQDDNAKEDAWINTRGTHAINEKFLTQETGFEADTELSDNEGKGRKIDTDSIPIPVVLDMETENTAPVKTKTITTSTTSSLVISPKLNNTIVKQPKKIDISKFNKSNRKSKNCAIFYFKHMDTDTENNNENNETNGSEVTKSDASSEGEWYFTSINENSICRRLDFDCESHSAAGPDLTYENLTQNTQNANTEISDYKTNCNKRNNTPMYSAESIQKLVLGAETLVLEDVLKSSPKHNKNILNELKMSATIATNNCESSKVNKVTKSAITKNKTVQEWLEHQPKEAASPDLLLVVSSTDCEASGEYTDSDNAISRDTDTSEEVTDSVATCLKGEMTSEQGTSTEKLGDSAEIIVGTRELFSITATAQKSKVLMRNIKRPSDRPWSVSCISQLTSDSTGADQCNGSLNLKPNNSHQQEVSSFSISESAINTLYSQCSRSPKTTNSKNSLKRRRLRTKKRTDSKRFDSGSEDLTPRSGKSGLSKSESFSGKVNFGDDVNSTNAFSAMTRSCHGQLMSTTQKESSDERSTMTKPDFRIGEKTNLYGTCTSLNLGSLDFATTLQYDGSKFDKDGHGTEETSSFSEQAWDSYQEKYLSEPYSEDAADARHLLEFGDDYRNYLDSQSDNCSSLSAANIDSMSPRGHRKNVADAGKKAGSATPESSLELRQQRVLELPVSERFRRNSGKSEERRRSWNLNNYDSDNSGRKADTVSNCRKFSESDSSSLKRRSARSGMLFRSISHQTTSSSCSSDIGEEDIEVKNLLLKTNDRLEHTKALRIRSHLLRPEDYKEIISTCQNNIHCLEAILTGPPGTVLSDTQCHTIKELLAAWDDLSKWSETASVARQLQDEMRSLKTNIEKLGKKCTTFDNEVAIIEIINELKNDQLQMQTYRSSMLTLNATVHHWLTQQELNQNKMTTESVEVKTRTTLVQQEVILSETEHINSEKGSQIDSYYDANLHNLLKNDVSEMYRMWDNTNDRIRCRLENLEASLIIWKQFENGLSQFQTTLNKDRGALSGLRGALETGVSTDQNELISNIQLVAKLLSERIDNSIQISSDKVLNLDPSSAVLTSSDHLSDSGISDGDGSLSERERRLGALRRLAKQLENSLAPGSHALKTITDRMEAAEQELRELQKTCRELIIKTAVAQDPTLENLNIDLNTPLPINVQMPVLTVRNKNKRSPLSKCKNKRRSPTNTLAKSTQKPILSNHNTSEEQIEDFTKTHGNDVADAGINNSSVTDDDADDDDEKNDFKKRWISRIMSIAVPVQLAIITIFCVCCIFEPHCCDSLNNFSMSFSPQLRYIKGPPPV